MKCTDVKELFSQHSDSDSEVTGNPEFVRHISECAQCRSEFENHVKLVKALKKGFSNFTPWPEKEFSFKFPVQQSKAESVADTVLRILTTSWQSFATLAIACVILFFAFFGSGGIPVCEFYLKSGRLADIAAKSQTSDGKLSSRLFMAEVESQICCSLSDSTDSPTYFQARVAQDSVFNIKQEEITLESGMLWVKHRDVPVKIAIPGAKINIIGTEFIVAVSENRTLLRLFEGKLELITTKETIEIKTGENYLCGLAGNAFISIDETMLVTWNAFSTSPEDAFNVLYSAFDQKQPELSPKHNPVPVTGTGSEKILEPKPEISSAQPPKTFAPASAAFDNSESNGESELESGQDYSNPVEGLGN